MSAITTFKRSELKYIISIEQKEKLVKLFEKYMIPDKYDKYTLFNIYFDTPDYLLIRRSIEKPVYKEKLRARSYGQLTDHAPIYLELKKKYKSVVYKRRISLDEEAMNGYFADECTLPDTQIGKEIDYFKTLYHDIAPRVFIGYDRSAYFGMDREDLRITFDENILWRDTNVTLSDKKYGQQILDSSQVLMEIKAIGSIPLWLIDFLTEEKIYRTSFSKYGRAYRQMITEKKGA